MKKPPRRRSAKKSQKVAGPWMHVLAHLAAEARVDGGAGLQLLLHYAKFDERPQLSLTKRAAA
jgi:hypothetical protein